MLLTLTWRHCTPTETPTSPFKPGTSFDLQLDNVACACYISRQGGAAALLHQGCPVPVRDCQVVVAITVVVVTGGRRLNVKCSES